MMYVEMVFVLKHAIQYVVFGCACTKVQELLCSPQIIIVADIIVKPLDHSSSLLGVYTRPNFGFGSFRTH